MSSEDGGEDNDPTALGLLTGPYILRDLLTNVPLSEDGHEEDLKITCVEFWSRSLVFGRLAVTIALSIEAVPKHTILIWRLCR